MELTESQGGEADLLLRVAACGPDAEHCFDQLYELHWRRVYGKLRKLARSDEAIDDLCQEVWTKIWKRASQFTGATDAEARAWIFAIVKNAFLDGTKRKPERVLVRLGEENDPPGQVEDRRHGNWEALEELMKVLRNYAVKCIGSFDSSLQQDIVRLWWLTRSSKAIRASLSETQPKGMPNIARLVKRFRECIKHKFRQDYPEGPPAELFQV